MNTKFWAVLLLMGVLLFGCTMLAGLDQPFVVKEAEGSVGPGGSGSGGSASMGGVGGEGGTGGVDSPPCMPSVELCGTPLDESCDGPGECTGDYRWAKLFGSTDDDMELQRSESVATDSAGNIVLAGLFKGSIDFGKKSHESAGARDIFVAKLSPSGEYLWSMSFGDVFDQQALSVATDSKGNIVLTGKVEGIIDFGGDKLSSAGGYDIFLLKLSPVGKHIFSKLYGNNVDDTGFDVTIDSNDNILLTGQFAGMLYFDVNCDALSAGAEGSAFITKLGPAGDCIWSNSFSEDAGVQRGASVATDSAGDVVVLGAYSGQIDFKKAPTALNQGLTDVFLAKLSAKDGEVQWHKEFGSTGDDAGSGVAVDSQEDIVITGTYSGNMQGLDGWDGVFSGGELPDIFVAKFSAIGETKWTKGFGNDKAQISYSIAMDAADNIVFSAGFVGSVDFGGGMLPSPGDYYSNVAVVKLAADGSHVWSKAFGDSKDQFSLGVATDSVGDVVLTGAAAGSIDFGGGPLSSPGDYDAFVAKLAP